MSNADIDCTASSTRGGAAGVNGVNGVNRAAAADGAYDETGARDEAVERFAKGAFDESVARVDGAVRLRLHQARSRALDELRSPAELEGWARGRSGTTLFGAGAGWPRGLAWAAAGTTIAVALAMSLLLRHGDPAQQGGMQLTAYGDLEWLGEREDLEWLAEREDLELLEEDLEFYAWLAQQPELALNDEPER